MKVLVYGWYHQHNIGDDLFIDAFGKIFPEIEFVFHDNIKLETLENIDAIFFGGGSFLLGQPKITEDALRAIKIKPIFYIGIGIETEIHPIHLELMGLARLIATRSIDQVDRVKLINSNTIWIPDLVYSLQSDVVISPKLERSVLVLPNISVVPSHDNPHWAHVSWSHFKSEFVQFLDILSQEKFKINFLSMGQSDKINDDWAAGEIISHMNHRDKYLLKEESTNIKEITKIISQYSLILTQRFHGIVLSEMVRVPYIAIHHHDKLKFSKPSEGTFLSYYSCSKQNFIDSFNETMKMKFTNELPIESTIFETLKREVLRLI